MAVTIATDVVGILRGNLPMNAVNEPGEVENVRRELGLEPIYRATC
jgi:D-3-phosphoglycerate dehydrogenase